MAAIKSLKVVLLIYVLTLAHTHGQPSSKFFRKDYTYLSAPNGFYKIHTIHRTWQDAKVRCEMEGASLFYAEDQVEAGAVIDLWNKTQPFAWVYVGISSLIAKGVFETIDGRAIADVYDTWAPGEPNDVDGNEDCVILRREGTLNDVRCDNKYPFICKKPFDTLQWNNDCDMPNTDYVYNSELGRCYKFHLKPRNWSDAVATCSAEQSYLTVVNSQAEANYLVQLTEQSPKDKVSGNFLRGAVYLGFYNRGEGWQTIKGTSLEDSGYSKWGNQQPDGSENEQCGSMFYNGHLNDMSCDLRSFFICEHEIGVLNDSFDDRFLLKSRPNTVPKSRSAASAQR